jgi:hypothetical protein
VEIKKGHEKLHTRVHHNHPGGDILMTKNKSTKYFEEKLLGFIIEVSVNKVCNLVQLSHEKHPYSGCFL